MLVQFGQSPAKPGGMVQYFYSSPHSALPVRDVTNAQGAGFKTEPHLEAMAENYLKPCAQQNIRWAISQGVQYLFLVTRCANRALTEHFGKQYVVGYIRNDRNIPRTNLRDGRPFSAIQGKTHMVSYDNAIPVLDYFDSNFSRARISSHGRLNQSLTAEWVAKLESKPNILGQWLAEVARLQSGLSLAIQTELAQLAS